MTQIEKLKKEQMYLKEVRGILNDRLEDKVDMIILVNKYISENFNAIKDAEELEKKPKLTPDEENLIKYRKLKEDFEKARDNRYGYYRKCAGDWGGFDKLTPEQKIKHNELEKIEDDIRKEIKRMEENELNKPKTIKINNKSYIVANAYESHRGWGPRYRCIIVGETEKMYKIQFVRSKFDRLDSAQTSYYHYEYPTTINDKLATKGKNRVKEIKIYEEDTYERLCD